MSNTISLVGNLTREPEIRYTSGNKAVCNLGVAVSRRYQVNGEWQEETSFFNLTAWGSLGENAAASFKKGDRVLVTGRMQARDYEVDGVKKTAWECVVDEIGPSLRWARVSIDKVNNGTTTVRPAAPAPAPSAGGVDNGDPVYGTPEDPF